jgi:hypothetical protein
MAADPARGLALIREYYRLEAETDKDVVALVMTLRGDATDEATVKQLSELQSGQSKAGRPLLRAVLDDKTPAAVRRGAREALGRLGVLYRESPKLTRAVLALEMMGTPESRKMLEAWAENLPPTQGGDAANDALLRLKSRKKEQAGNGHD